MRVPGLSRHSSVSLNNAITRRARDRVHNEDRIAPLSGLPHCNRTRAFAGPAHNTGYSSCEWSEWSGEQRTERRGYDGSFRRNVRVGPQASKSGLLVTGGLSLFRVEIEREHGCGREVEAVEIRSLRCHTVSRQQQSQLKLSDVNQPRRVSQPRLSHLMSHAACNMRHATYNMKRRTGYNRPAVMAVHST